MAILVKSDSARNFEDLPPTQRCIDSVYIRRGCDRKRFNSAAFIKKKGHPVTWAGGRGFTAKIGSRCQAKSSQWRGISAATWEKRHPSLMSFPKGVKPQWRLFTQLVSCGTRAGCRGDSNVASSSVVWSTRHFLASRPFCPSKAQYQALTSLVTCLARRVMAGAAARRGEHGQVRTLTNKEVLRFWKLAPSDVEARVRRLKWAQTLVQDTSHHVQVLTAMFGKLPAESSATLNPEGELTPEANPWAVRWMEDLEALQPYDERGVIQRMGKDVRALFLDRELADDFVAIDVSVLRLQSLSTQVPPWDFREEVGHPMEVSQEGVPQWRCCFDDQCEAKFESFKALATHVLRHHRQMETVSRLVLTNQCPVCLAVYGDRKAAHRHLLSSLRRGSCRDRSRYLGQVLIPQSLCCPVCSAEPGNWSELQSHLAEHLSSVFNGFRNAGLGKRKSEEAPQSQGRRAVRQAVAEGGSEREVLRRLVDVLTTLSLVNAAELRDLTSTVFKTYLVPSTENVAEAMAEAGRLYHDSAGAIKNKPEAERADAQEQLGPPLVYVWVAFLRSLASTKELGAEHVAVLRQYWENSVLKSAPVQLVSHVRYCRTKPCRKVEGKEGWTRIVFCLDPITFPLEGALEAALRRRCEGNRALSSPSGAAQLTHG